MAGLINTENKNNHAGIERREASERAEAILKLINEYRLYAHRFETLPTWDVLNFLNKLQNELFERFGKEVTDGERDKARNEYFLVVGKKPFQGWDTEEVYKKIEEFKNTPVEPISNKTLHSKKTRWQKALKK